MTTATTTPTPPDVHLEGEDDFVGHLTRLHGGVRPSGRDLWLVLLEGDGHWLPVLPVVGDSPAEPEAAAIRNLFLIVDMVLGDGGGDAEDGHVAIVLDRPGPDGPTGADRAWAAALRHGARASLSHFLGTYLFVAGTPRRLDDDTPDWPRR